MSQTLPTFYQTYLGVVYGAVAVKGLEYFLAPPQKLTPGNVLLFCATVITGLHFWLICQSSDRVSDDFYSVWLGAEQKGLDNLLLLVDLFFATGFAVPVLFMFRHLAENPVWFFGSFAGLTVLSVSYDIIALLGAAFGALRAAGQDEKERVRVHVRTYGLWFGMDLVYAAIGVTLAFYSPYYSQRPTLFGALFLCLVIVSVTVDVVILNADLYHHLQPTTGPRKKRS